MVARVSQFQPCQFAFVALPQLLKFNLEKKTTELVREDFPLVQIVDRGWVGVSKIKNRRMRERCYEEMGFRKEFIRSNG